MLSRSTPTIGANGLSMGTAHIPVFARQTVPTPRTATVMKSNGLMIPIVIPGDGCVMSATVVWIEKA